MSENNEESNESNSSDNGKRIIKKECVIVRDVSIKHKPRDVESTKTCIEAVTQFNVAVVKDQKNYTDSGVGFKFRIEDGIVKYKQLTPILDNRENGSGVIEEELKKWNTLTPCNSDSDDAQIISYTDRRLGEKKSQDVEFDMIAADGNRIFVKEKGKERFYFATLCDEFMHYNPDPFAEKDKLINVPGFYMKLDANFDNKGLKNEGLEWWPNETSGYNGHVSAWIFQFAKILKEEGLLSTCDHVATCAYRSLPAVYDPFIFLLKVLINGSLTSPLFLNANIIPNSLFMYPDISFFEDDYVKLFEIFKEKEKRDGKLTKNIEKSFEDLTYKLKMELEQISRCKNLNEISTYWLAKVERIFSQNKEGRRVYKDNPIPVIIEMAEIFYSLFRGGDHFQQIKVEPGVFHEIDNRPPESSVDPKNDYTRTISKTKRDVIAFNKVLSIGVGHEHRHTQYQNMYGGEYQAGPAGIIWSSLNDRAGFWDGTCNFYMLVQLGDFEDDENGNKIPKNTDEYTVLWADEQSYFSSRWRSIDPQDSNWDKFNCNTPLFYYWSPFNNGWINKNSRMAVSNQTIVVTGNKGDNFKIFTMNRSFGSSDLTWRWRYFPLEIKIDIEEIDDLGFPKIDNAVNPKSVQIHADMTIYFKGKKNGEIGYFYQKYLPADNWECPTKYELVISKIKEIDKYNQGYDIPWKFSYKDTFEKMCNYKYIGVYEHSVHCRSQYYLVELNEKENCICGDKGLKVLTKDNNFRWFNNETIDGKFQLHVSSNWDNFKKPLNPLPGQSSCFFNNNPSLRIVNRNMWKSEKELEIEKEQQSEKTKYKNVYLATHWDIRDDELSYFNGTSSVVDELNTNLINSDKYSLKNVLLKGCIDSLTKKKLEKININIGNWTLSREAPVVNSVTLIRNNTELLLRYKSSKPNISRSDLSEDLNSLKNKLDALIFLSSQLMLEQINDGKFDQDIINKYQTVIKDSFDKLIKFHNPKDFIKEYFIKKTFDDTIWRMRVYAFDTDGSPIRFFTIIVPESFIKYKDENGDYVFSYTISLEKTKTAEVEMMTSNGKWVDYNKNKKEKETNYTLFQRYLKDEQTYLEKGTSIVFEGITGYVSTAEEVIFSD